MAKDIISGTLSAANVKILKGLTGNFNKTKLTSYTSKISYIGHSTPGRTRRRAKDIMSGILSAANRKMLRGANR
jgi:hypothetical protein